MELQHVLAGGVVRVARHEVDRQATHVTWDGNGERHEGFKGHRYLECNRRTYRETQLVLQS